MTVLFVLGGGLLSYWLNAHRFSVWLFGPSPDDFANNFQAGAWMFLAGAMAGHIALSVLEATILPVLSLPAVLLKGVFKGRLGNIWSTNFGRRLIGMLMGGGVMLPIAGLVFSPIVVITVLAWQRPGWHALDDGFSWLLAITAALLSLFLARLCSPSLKPWIGRKSRPWRRFWHSLSFGYGGSSRFAGLMEEWRHPWKPGTLKLGNSLHDRSWEVGIVDDRHFVTIATNRSGKGVSAIIPNLLSWPGSILCIDPKGENAAVTAQARRDMGQVVHIVDPFKVLAGIGVMDKISRYNPMSEIDPMSMNVYEMTAAVAEGLVKPGAAGDSFWDEASGNLFSGLVAHACSWPGLTDEQRTLAQVHRWVHSPDGLPLKDMLNNPLAGEIPQMVAGAFTGQDAKVQSNILTTAQTHIKWLNSPALRESLSASDFSLRDLKRRPTTVYVVIPPNILNSHGSWLRLFVNMAIQATMDDARKAPDDVLFILDEFFALGRMDRLQASYPNIGGYGVRLWPILQNLGQLQEHYPKNWEGFLGNAGMVQVFAVNDLETAKYFSERLGHHVRWRKMNGPDGTEYIPQSATMLRSPVELAVETSRDDGGQFIYREGGQCFFLERQPYFKTFKSTVYRSNPFQERAVRSVDEKTVPAT